jgi:cytochrome c
VLIACQETPAPTATPVQFNPTAAPLASPTPTPTGGAPTATRAPVATQSPAGDATRGQTLFAQIGCSACHTTTSAQLVGPGMAGVYDRASTRMAGQSADAYIEDSIREPSKFIVPPFADVMPKTFKDQPAQDISDIIAFLKTLK